MAYKEFANGYPLYATEINSYLMNQSVIVFADSAARSAAISSPTEGMVTYLEDTNRTEVYNSGWVDITTIPITEQTGTTYTITAADSQTTVFIDNALGTTVTIADVLRVGDRIDFIQKGAGIVTFAADTGVTLNSKDAALDTAGQFAAATVIKEATNTYYLIGNLA